MQLDCRNTLLDLSSPVVMGVLNITPDSFSDGGKYTSVATALKQTLQMIADGVRIIDVGGESTRPGANAVSVDEECQRVIPVIESIRRESDVIISIDTSKAEVMRAAINAGANIINDVRALQEPGALSAAAKLDVPVCLMHMQGEPRTMQKSPVYKNVVEDVKRFLLQRVKVATDAGIKPDKIILDPGFGFGKTLAHNISLFKALNQFTQLGMPVLAGVSRKTMIGALLNDAPVEQRVNGSVALAALAAYMGALILRVHDVKPTVDALKVATAMAQKEAG